MTIAFAKSWVRRSAWFFCVATSAGAMSQTLGIADYPEEALWAGEEGYVGYSIEISETGAIGQCAIVKSSGHPSLDAATCPLVIARARLRPATDDAGKPIRSTMANQVHWQIDRTDPNGAMTLAHGRPFPLVLSERLLAVARSYGRDRATARLDINEAGKMAGCSLIDPTGSVALDQAICNRLKRFGVFEPAKDDHGKPIGATILQQVSLFLTH